MKYCLKCGVEQKNDAAFCNNCGAEFPKETIVENNKDESTVKLLSAISYIGILWLVGMFVPEYKEDSRVRFHVGQGIIYTIFDVALSIISGIIGGVVGVLNVAIPFFHNISWIITTALDIGIAVISIYLFVKGLISAIKQTNEPLPIIGKYSFYK